ncbi:winged helix family transcriptional regulator, partial [Actinomadura logoneensis]
MTFGVLGPLAVADAHGRPVEVRGARPRAVLARLLVAAGRMVPASVLVDDLWDDPPAGALGAVQTFVGTLRRAGRSPAAGTGRAAAGPARAP